MSICARPDQQRGDVTTVWKDGEVWRTDWRGQTRQMRKTDAEVEHNAAMQRRAFENYPKPKAQKATVSTSLTEAVEL